MNKNQEQLFIKSIRKYLKTRIKTNHIFNTYEQERKQIENLIKLAVTNGASNSSLIISPEESGKSIFLKNVLEHLTDSIDLNSNAIIIKLNGHVHNNDRLALKSCTIQMNLDQQIGENELSGTFAENLAFLLNCFKIGDRTKSKCLVFILEEIDLFCNHSNQTLLYNLLDMTQCAQTPIYVLGLTSRLDIIELFEKRVKSRFSHRLIYLLPHEIPIDKKLERIETLLSIQDSKIVNNKRFRDSWNANINKLIKEEQFANALSYLSELTTDDNIIRNILFEMISEIENVKSLKSETFLQRVEEYMQGNRIQVLISLSVLEICLIVAMHHHRQIYDGQPFNFRMILERYRKFTQSNALLTQTVDNSVVQKAFEHIQYLELIIPFRGGNNNNNRCQKEYELFELLLRPEQITSAFGTATFLPTEVKQWITIAPI